MEDISAGSDETWHVSRESDSSYPYFEISIRIFKLGGTFKVEMIHIVTYIDIDRYENTFSISPSPITIIATLSHAGIILKHCTDMCLTVKWLNYIFNRTHLEPSYSVQYIFCIVNKRETHMYIQCNLNQHKENQLLLLLTPTCLGNWLQVTF